MNKLLLRQVGKYMGGVENVPHNFMALLNVISASYDHNEKDRKIIERSMELSSKELIELNQELEVKNKQLAQKNKELEQFAYVASHDLQEPLTTTVSVVNILKRHYYGQLDTRADKYLEYIFQSVERMSRLIRDLLDFSRIGKNKKFVELDCNEVVNGIIEDMGTSNTNSDAIIIAGDLPVIKGYPAEITQLFQNLTYNAIKFRRPGVHPKLKIAAKKTSDQWQFSFSDNGIGIEEQYHEKIFVIFQRLHDRTEYQGSGIGLSHCKKIVELHEGKIWVESAPGEGSVFYFTIPEKNII